MDIVVWIFVNPQEILGPVTFCCILIFRSRKQLIWSRQIIKAAVYNSHNPVLSHNSCRLRSPYRLCYKYWNCVNYKYIYIHTYLDIMYSSFLSVQNSEWTSLATHSVHYNSWLRWTAQNFRHHKTATDYCYLPSDAKHSLPPVTAECIHSVESVNGVCRGQEGFNIISCKQRWVNILSQTLYLEIFLPYYLFSLYFAV